MRVFSQANRNLKGDLIRAAAWLANEAMDSQTQGDAGKVPSLSESLSPNPSPQTSGWLSGITGTKCSETPECRLVCK